MILLFAGGIALIGSTFGAKQKLKRMAEQEVNSWETTRLQNKIQEVKKKIEVVQFEIQAREDILNKMRKNLR